MSSTLRWPTRKLCLASFCCKNPGQHYVTRGVGLFFGLLPLWIKKNIILIWTQIPLLLWCLSKSHDLRRSTLKYFEGEKEFRLSVWPARVLAQHLAKSLIKLSKEIKYHISTSNTQIWIHFYNFWWFIILNLSHRVKINDKNGLHYFLFFKNFKICPQN